MFHFVLVFFFSIQSTTKNTSLIASLVSQAYTWENKTHRFMLSSVALEKSKGEMLDRQKKKGGGSGVTKRKEFLF